MTSNPTAAPVAPDLGHAVSHHGQMTPTPPQNAGRSRNQTYSSSTIANEEKKAGKPERERKASAEEGDAEPRFNLAPLTPRMRWKVRAAAAAAGGTFARSSMRQEGSDNGAFGEDIEIPDYPPPTFEEAIWTTAPPASTWVPQASAANLMSATPALLQSPALSPSPRPHSELSNPAMRFLSIIVEPSSSPQISPVTPYMALPLPSPTTYASQSNANLSSPISPSLDSDSDSLEIVTLPLDVAQRQWEEDRRKGLPWQDRTKREWERHIATRPDITLAQEVPPQPEAGPSRPKSQTRLTRPDAAYSQTEPADLPPRRVPSLWRETLDEPALTQMASVLALKLGRPRNSTLPLAHGRSLPPTGTVWPYHGNAPNASNLPLTLPSAPARRPVSVQTGRVEMPTRKYKRRLFTRGKSKVKDPLFSDGDLNDDEEPFDTWEVISKTFRRREPPEQLTTATSSTASAPKVKPRSTLMPHFKASDAQEETHAQSRGAKQNDTGVDHFPINIIPSTATSSPEVEEEQPEGRPLSIMETPINCYPPDTPFSGETMQQPVAQPRAFAAVTLKEPRGRPLPVPPSDGTPRSVQKLHKTSLDTFPAVVDALAHFDTDISPWDSPHKWNDAYDSHIRSICQILTLIMGEDDLPGTYLSSHMIYPGLIVYLFIQLTACTANEKTAFGDMLKKWRTWDVITVFEEHQQVKDYLIGMFVELKRLDSALHSRRIFETLLALDVVNFSAQLTILVMNDDCYKKLIKRHEEPAQVLVNILQERLGYPIQPPFKTRHRKALVKLSEQSQRYPECLLLEDITISQDPVQGGSFGEVFKGDMAGCPIAVKVLKVYQKSNMDKILKSFSREAVIWRQLSHPNVLPFYGVFRGGVANRPKLCLVSPWMQNGDMAHFLSQIDEIDCVPLALDVANGLEYLHSQRVLHADLKCVSPHTTVTELYAENNQGNILVSDARRACLADFGVSITKDSNSILLNATSTRNAIGTLAWTAPELVLGKIKKPDEACDVYSFGMVCYEMFSGCTPFKGNSIPQVIMAIHLGQRPDRPVDRRARERGLTDDIWDIIVTCWHQQPEMRLAASDAVRRLSTQPDRPPDNRPEGHFSIPPQSRAASRQAQHPFAILQMIYEQDSTGMPFIPGSISQIFGLADSWDSIGE